MAELKRGLVSGPWLPTALGGALLAVGILWLEWLGLLLSLAGSAVLLRAAGAGTPTGLRLIGPLVKWELGRAVTQTQTFRARVYALLGYGAIGLAVAWAASNTAPAQRFSWSDQMLLIGGVLLLAQFLVMLFTAPSLTASVITTEKEKQSLDFLLVTQLTTQEIFLGKLAAQFIVVVSLMTLQVPLVLLTIAAGGLSWTEYGCFLLVTLMTASTGLALGGMFSVEMPQTKRALGAATGGLIWMGILIGWTRELPVILTKFGVSGWPLTCVEYVVDALNTGQPFEALRVAQDRLQLGFTYEAVLLAGVSAYVRFHALLTLGLVLWSLARLRIVAARRTEAAVQSRTVDATKWTGVVPRPRVSDRPLLWREMHCRPENPWRFWHLRLGQVLTVVLTVGTVGGMLAAEWFEVPHVALGIAVLMVVGSAATVGLAGMYRTAVSLARAREQNTLDDLLMTALTPREMLWQTLWGCLGHVRGIVIWSAGIAAVLLCLQPVHGVLLLVVWVSALLQGFGYAGAGLWCATRAKTMQQASLWVGLGGLGFTMLAPLMLIAAAYFDVGKSLLAGIIGLSVGLAPYGLIAIVSGMVPLFFTPLRPTADLWLSFDLGLLAGSAITAAVGWWLLSWTEQSFARQCRPKLERTLVPPQTVEVKP